MKTSIVYTVVTFFCLLICIGVQAEILKSKNMYGPKLVAVKNSEYGYFPFRTTESYQIEKLDMGLEDKIIVKNLEEVKNICVNPKKEDSNKPHCYSEELLGSNSIAKRICEVATIYSCQ